MRNIKNKILVQSGKGGVGKTTVAVNLAYILSKKGFKTGLLDVDIHGPNVPKMLNLEDKKISINGTKMVPVKANENLHVLSIAFLMDSKENALIWRGPMKHNILKQFVEDSEWGDLDYLIIDFPPGTGDEAISISQLLNDIKGTILVSTPQEVALIDITKSIDFSRKVDIPIIGIIENMAGDVFGRGSIKKFADQQNIAFLGSLELDKQITESSDKGIPFTTEKGSSITESFENITDNMMAFCSEGDNQ